MSRFRLAVAAGLVTAAAAAPFTSSASAMVCHESIRPVCSTLGLVCRTVADNPHLGVQCVQLG